MKSKVTLKSFHELSVASVESGDNHPSADKLSPLAFFADERAHQPLALSVPLTEATIGRLRVRDENY